MKVTGQVLALSGGYGVENEYICRVHVVCVVGRKPYQIESASTTLDSGLSYAWLDMQLSSASFNVIQPM